MGVENRMPLLGPLYGHNLEDLLKSLKVVGRLATRVGVLIDVAVDVLAKGLEVDVRLIAERVGKVVPVHSTSGAHRNEFAHRYTAAGHDEGFPLV